MKNGQGFRTGCYQVLSWLIIYKFYTYFYFTGQYMVVQDQAMGLSLSNDTFRQLKDRRRHRRQAGKVKTPISRA